MKPLKATVYIETELSPNSGEHVRYVVQKTLDDALKYRPIKVALKDHVG